MIQAGSPPIAPPAGAAQGSEDAGDGFTHLGNGHLLLAYIAGTFSFSFSLIVTFMLPLRARELDTPLALIGFLIGAGSLVAAVTSIPSGALTQRIGPQRVFVLGTVLCTGLSVVMGFTTSYIVLLIVQLALGAARTASWVAIQTYITNVGRPSQRVTITGRFSFATNVGTMVAPLLIGPAAQILGYSDAFFFIAGVALFFVVIGLFLKPIALAQAAPNSEQSSSAGFSAAYHQLLTRGIQIAVILTFVRVWYQTTWSAFFPLFLVEGGMSESVAATVISSTSLVATGVALTAGRAAKLGSRPAVAGVSLAIGALSVVISPYLTAVPQVYLISLLYGVGVGISLPLLLAMFSEEAPPGGRGVAMGVRTSGNQVAALTAPSLSGIVIGAVGISLGFLASGGIAWVLVGAAIVLHQRRVRGQRAGPTEPGSV